MNENISQFAIYDHPSDYPDHFVVREWRVKNGQVEATEECWLTKTIEDARALIPNGFYNIGRWTGDDPVIVEVWI